MKFRFMLGFLVLLAGLAFMGLSAQPAQAQTAAGVELSAADRANLQSLLTATKTALDIVQVQVNQGTVQNPTAMVTTLSGIRTYLLSMQSLLGGAPQAAAPQTAGPVAAGPQTSGGVGAGQVAGEADQVAQGDGAASDEATTSDEDEDADVMPGGILDRGDEGSPADEAGETDNASQWAFWIILIVAVVLAIVLARPRRQSGVMPQRTQAPPAGKPQEQKPQEPQRAEQKTDKTQ